MFPEVKLLKLQQELFIIAVVREELVKKVKAAIPKPIK